MKLLLDTHAILWWLEDRANLSETARDAISDPANFAMVSAVSAWEIAIKRSLGKLDAPLDFMEAIDLCGFYSLPITMKHGLATESLPALHRDPFDRMLVAQAMIENATLVTRDPLIRQYGIATINA